jgi:hypothetical protein
MSQVVAHHKEELTRIVMLVSLTCTLNTLDITVKQVSTVPHIKFSHTAVHCGSLLAKPLSFTETRGSLLCYCNLCWASWIQQTFSYPIYYTLIYNYTFKCLPSLSFTTELLNFLLCSFLQVPPIFTILGTNIFLSNSFSNDFNQCSSL